MGVLALLCKEIENPLEHVGSRGSTEKRDAEGPEGSPGKIGKWDLLEAKVELEHVVKKATR